MWLFTRGILANSPHRNPPRLGGTPRLGILATLHLSQISEFALVICSLGMGFGHIDPRLWCRPKLRVGGPARIQNPGGWTYPKSSKKKIEKKRTRIYQNAKVCVCVFFLLLHGLSGRTHGWGIGFLLMMIDCLGRLGCFYKPRPGAAAIRAQDASTLEIIIWVCRR